VDEARLLAEHAQQARLARQRWRVTRVLLAEAVDNEAAGEAQGAEVDLPRLLGQSPEPISLEGCHQPVDGARCW
jgi:hypothetical protein